MSQFRYHLDKALNFPGAGKIIEEKGIRALNEALRNRGEEAKRQRAGTEVSITSEDLPRRKTRKATTDEDEIMQQMADMDAEIDEMRRRLDLLQDMKGQEDTYNDLKRRIEALEAPPKGKQYQAPDGTLESMFGYSLKPAPDNQVQRQTTSAPSPVFGTLFTGNSAPPVKKGRSMFDPFFRTMDVPVQRQTQQAAPSTVESLTRRQRK